MRLLASAHPTSLLAQVKLRRPKASRLFDFLFCVTVCCVLCHRFRLFLTKQYEPLPIFSYLSMQLINFLVHPVSTCLADEPYCLTIKAVFCQALFSCHTQLVKTIHVRFECLRNGNTAIRVLAVFQYRHQCSAYREPGAI